MSNTKTKRTGIVAVAVLAALCSSRGNAAEGTDGPAKAVAAPADAQAVPVKTRVNDLLGVEPVPLGVLAARRGAADVYNDMQLKGVVADNRAVNVTTGANLITEGAFSNAAGVPMVVQNSGNNVLIQNATIINLQVN